MSQNKSQIKAIVPPAPSPAPRSGLKISERKLKILAEAAKYDASCSSSGGRRKRDPNGMGHSEGMGICHSYAPDGRCISLLKILLTNVCIYDCKFCVNRVSSDVPRASFTPEEVIYLTLEFYRRNYIEGLFLSSGIAKSSDATMESLIQVAKGLRKDHRFNGYIHLKVVAGASKELIDEAGLWADRVSANIELPTQNDLDLLAPGKSMNEVFQSMGEIKNKNLEYMSTRNFMKSTPQFAPAGQTTQMVVGASQSPDFKILKSSENLYQDFSLRRVYYSAYSPIPKADGMLPVERPSLVRENRLYQADWLLRFYGFKADELLSEDDPNLSLEMDPKTSWALKNRHFFPVDINKDTKEKLLRVPGLGAKTVQKILQLRRYKKVTLEDLVKLKATLKRAKYFIVTAEVNSSLNWLDRLSLEHFLKPQETQLSLFDQNYQKVSGDL